MGPDRRENVVMGLRITGDCLNCGVCLDNCRMVAITERDERYCIDPDECTECGICQGVCPVQAIVLEENETQLTSDN